MATIGVSVVGSVTAVNDTSAYSWQTTEPKGFAFTETDAAESR